MEDQELSRNAGRFQSSGKAVLGLGVVVGIVGGLLWLLGTATTDVLQGIGGMFVWLGVVLATVGLVLLAIWLVTTRMARHKPFA